MAKKRIGVWIDSENIAAMDIVAGVVKQSRSRVINTIIGEEIDRLNEQMKKGSDDDWRNKEWN